MLSFYLILVLVKTFIASNMLQPYCIKVLIYHFSLILIVSACWVLNAKPTKVLKALIGLCEFSYPCYTDTQNNVITMLKGSSRRRKPTVNKMKCQHTLVLQN